VPLGTASVGFDALSDLGPKPGKLRRRKSEGRLPNSGDGLPDPKSHFHIGIETD
jgi:hypothetical protein